MNHDDPVAFKCLAFHKFRILLTIIGVIGGGGVGAGIRWNILDSAEQRARFVTLSSEISAVGIASTTFAGVTKY